MISRVCGYTRRQNKIKQLTEDTDQGDRVIVGRISIISVLRIGDMMASFQMHVSFHEFKNL